MSVCYFSKLNKQIGFIELDKAVVLEWLDRLVFCEYAISVSALWCPLATPTIYLGFSYLGRGVSPYHHCSWPSTWDSCSRPSCAWAATSPWVAPPGHQPWPRARGGFSQLPLTLDMECPSHACGAIQTMPAGQPEMGGSWWRGLTECGPL